jgi:hypothetical protein
MLEIYALGVGLGMNSLLSTKAAREKWIFIFFDTFANLLVIPSAFRLLLLQFVTQHGKWNMWLCRSSEQLPAMGAQKCFFHYYKYQCSFHEEKDFRVELGAERHKSSQASASQLIATEAIF